MSRSWRSQEGLEAEEPRAAVRLERHAESRGELAEVAPRDEVDAVLATDKLRVCSEAPVEEPVFSR